MISFYIVSILTTIFCIQAADGFCNDVLKQIFSSKTNQHVKKQLSITQKNCRELFRMRNIDIYFGMHVKCTDECKASVDKLYNVAPQIKNCECKRKQCRVIKRRANKCTRGEIDSQKRVNLVPGGCTSTYQSCHLNVGCRKEYDNMMRSCNSMLNDITCTMDCEKSLKALLTNKLGRKFVFCKCDGTQYYEGECLQIRDRILRKCSSKDFKNFLDTTKLRVVNRRA